MNKITKKTAFGVVGATAAGLLAIGAAAPAMASTGSDSAWDSTTSTYSSSTWMKSYTHLVGDITGSLGDVSGSVGDVSNESPVVVAPQVGVGDIASGDAVASGNDVTAPIASGNDTSTGNDNGNGSSVGTSVSDLGNIDGTVDGILRSVDLNTILQGR